MLQNFILNFLLKFWFIEIDESQESCDLPDNTLPLQEYSATMEKLINASDFDAAFKLIRSLHRKFPAEANQKEEYA